MKILSLVKEESGVELGDDFLILIVLKRYELCDAMELTRLQNPVEVHVPLTLHIVYVNPLSRNHCLAFVVENGEVPILMKEGPEPLMSAPFLG
jgi:hypothetical protein